jgi:plastocyanin
MAPVRRSALIVAVLALGLVPFLAGCGSSSSSSGNTTTEASGGEGEGGTTTVGGLKANNHGSKAVETSGKTEVELDDFYFEPTVLEGKAGQKVELELKNEGNVEHSFTVESQGIDKDLEPGDEGEVTVTIPKSGAISFFCKYHKSEGMAGALAVTGQSGGSGGMTGTGTTEDNGGKSGYGGY